MNAEIKYQSGYILIIPKAGNAPMLFLEWISQFRAAKVPIHKVTNDIDFLYIRMNVALESYRICADYINSNL
jgi:hypothetical protein